MGFFDLFGWFFDLNSDGRIDFGEEIMGYGLLSDLDDDDEDTPY